MPSQTLDPYATHLPILGMMLQKYRPKRVLEFGPGLHSTALFLSTPSVNQLVSVERDDEWLLKLADKFSSGRWELRHVDEKWPDPKDFDLVLIDDGKTIAERVETIQWALPRSTCPVIIHDTNIPEYQVAIELCAQVVYAEQTPWTSVVL